MNFTNLPGWMLVHQGLEDLATGLETEAALLVLVGSPRQRRIGIPVPGHVPLVGTASTSGSTRWIPIPLIRDTTP